MYILGINCMHDSAFTILSNNTVLTHFQLERYTKQKHHTAFSEPDFLKGLSGNFIGGMRKFVDLIRMSMLHSADSIALSSSDVDEEIKAFLRINNFPYSLAKTYNHRECHAASVFYTNPVEDCLIISLDGEGDGYIGIHKGNKDGSLSTLRTYHKYNLGMQYSYFSKFVVKKLTYTRKLNPEGIFMAYAATGKLDGSLHNYFDKEFFVNSPDMDEPLPLQNDIDPDKVMACHFNNLVDKSNLPDFAYTFQKVWLDRVMELVNYHRGLHKNLCVAGGSFLNVLLNYKLVKSGWFDKVYFTPVTDDSGQALGAALMDNKAKIKFSPFCGPHGFDADKFNDILSANLNRSYTTQELAQLIVDNNIVGVFRDRMEIGPRALGNRSIFANAMNANMKDILNSRVKNRESFRPFGVMVLREDVSNYWDIDGDFPYMNIVGYNTTDLFPAAKHVDNTTRIQTVSTKDNLWVYNLLQEVKKLTGHGVIINTSLNTSGQPIINWYSDAISMLKSNCLDALVLEDKLFLRG